MILMTACQKHLEVLSGKDPSTIQLEKIIKITRLLVKVLTKNIPATNRDIFLR